MPASSDPKTCAKCGTVYPRSEFPQVVRKGRVYPYSYCNPCRLALARAQYASKTPEQKAADAAGRTKQVKTPEQNAARAARKRAKRAEMTPAERKVYLARERAAKLFYAYGITREDQDAMWEAQGGLCDICREPLERRRYGYATDHCHTSGKVRSLTCTPCNTGLGGFRDNPEHLRAAIAYLERHHPADEGSTQEPPCPSLQTT